VNSVHNRLDKSVDEVINLAEAAKLALAAPEAALKLATDTWNALQAGITSGLKFTADCLAALADAGAFVLSSIGGSINVTAEHQELHLSAKMSFMGAELSVAVDIDFAEIDDFVNALVKAIMDTVHEKLNGFGVSLSVDGSASFSIGAK
jgi:hypothetical protein